MRKSNRSAIVIHHYENRQRWFWVLRRKAKNRLGQDVIHEVRKVSSGRSRKSV